MDFTLLYAVIPLALIAVLLASLKHHAGPAPVLISMSAVAVIIIGSVLAPVIDDVNHIEPPAHDWQYDDYVEVDGVDSASGSLELIQIGGTTYAHAKDVGQGTLTSTTGVTREYTIAKAPLDVFLAVGQSNIAYYLYDLPAASPTPSIGTTYYYGASNSPISLTGQSAVIDGSYDTTFSSYDMYDMVYSDGRAHIANIDGPFSAEYHRLSGNKVYFINSAVAGTAIESFAPGESQYNYMTALLGQALDDVDLDKFEITSKTVLFCQSWSLTDVDGYLEIFGEVYDALDSDGFEKWFIIREPRSNGAVAYDAQTIIAQTYSNVWIGSALADGFTAANGMLLSDGVHFSQLGDNKISAGLAKYVDQKRPF